MSRTAIQKVGTTIKHTINATAASADKANSTLCVLTSRAVSVANIMATRATPDSEGLFMLLRSGINLDAEDMINSRSVRPVPTVYDQVYDKIRALCKAF